MTIDIIVFGAGYGGTAAIRSLQEEFGGNEDVSLMWVSKDEYHFVLHESYRLIRDASVREEITVPVEEIWDTDIEFVQGEVAGLDVDARAVELADGETIGYDLVVVCLGSRTAFFGIDGLENHALTLKSLDDAMAINEAVAAAGEEASEDDPAGVIVGGAGLTGIQTAGEIAAYRTERDFPMDVTLVEQANEIFLGHDHEFQGSIRNELDDHDVEIRTGTVIGEVDDETIHTEDGKEIDYDVLVWAGGVAGQNALDSANSNKEYNRVSPARP